MLRLALTGIVVLLLVAGGIMTGARLWPQVVTVEKRVVAPIRVGRQDPSPAETLPDLVDAACASVVRIVLPEVPAPAPSPAPTPTHRRHGKARRAPVAPVPVAAPPPLDGIVVSSDGYIVTAAARLAGVAGAITAQVDGAAPQPATLVASDPVSGLALLKIDATNLSPLQMADGSLARVGTWGFALVSPAGTGCSVRTGIIASDSIAEQAPLGSWLRLSAPDGATADGAPFLDADGKLLGLATLRDPADPDSANLLLPGALVGRVADYVIRNGKAPASAFGLISGDLDAVLAGRLGADRQRGAVVLVVQPGSAADKAGLRVGDVILSAGDVPVSGASELARALDTDADSVKLDVARHDQHVAITLAS